MVVIENNLLCLYLQWLFFYIYIYTKVVISDFYFFLHTIYYYLAFHIYFA